MINEEDSTISEHDTSNPTKTYDTIFAMDEDFDFEDDDIDFNQFNSPLIQNSIQRTTVSPKQSARHSQPFEISESSARLIKLFGLEDYDDDTTHSSLPSTTPTYTQPEPDESNTISTHQKRTTPQTKFVPTFTPASKPNRYNIIKTKTTPTQPHKKNKSLKRFTTPYKQNINTTSTDNNISSHPPNQKIDKPTNPIIQPINMSKITEEIQTLIDKEALNILIKYHNSQILK